MTKKLTSIRAERTARLREQLDGASQRRGAREMQADPAGNLLWGVALHAAAKLDAGAALSDLERMLADAMLKLLPEDEVREIGRTWEQAAARDAVPLFPKAVAGLTADDSYSLASLTRDLPAIGADALAQPNASIVRVGEEGLDGPVDSDEFTDAMAEYGGGITVVLGPPAQKSAAQPMSVELHLPYFTCYKGTGDSFFGPDDEIYWTMAAGSDMKAEHVYGSPEFGSLSAGQKRNFPPGTALFAGTVAQTMFADIECWEKDRGGFWDTIKDALFDVAEACMESAAEIMNDGEKEDAALGALAALVFGIMGALLDLILGNDDLIQHRTIAFNRSAIEALVDKAGGDYDFRGEGAHYSLRIGARKLPSFMRYLTLDQGSSNWSIPQNMPGMHTLGNPGVTTNAGLLHCAVTAPSVERLDVTTFDGHIWSTPRQGIVPGRVTAGVGMTSYEPPTGSRVAYLVTRKDAGAPVAHSLSAADVAGPPITSSRYTSATPEIVAYNYWDSVNQRHQYHLYGVYRSNEPGDTQLWFARIDVTGKKWEAGNRIPDSAGHLGPAAAVHGGVLHVVHRSTSGDRLKHHSYDNAGGWRSLGLMQDHFSLQRPGLISFDGKLHCVYRGHNNNRLWWTTWAGGTWTDARMLEATSDTGPGLAVMNNQLYCVYHDDL